MGDDFEGRKKKDSRKGSRSVFSNEAILIKETQIMFQYHVCVSLFLSCELSAMLCFSILNVDF